MMDITVKDLRNDKATELGNIIEASGDSSLGYFTTEKGYRLVIEGYNLNQIY